MAIDTAQKRSSAIGLGQPYIVILPTPDGSVSQADRQDAAFSYSGILAGAAVEAAISKILTLAGALVLNIKTRASSTGVFGSLSIGGSATLTVRD